MKTIPCKKEVEEKPSEQLYPFDYVKTHEGVYQLHDSLDLYNDYYITMRHRIQNMYTTIFFSGSKGDEPVAPITFIEPAMDQIGRKFIKVDADIVFDVIRK